MCGLSWRSKVSHGSIELAEEFYIVLLLLEVQFNDLTKSQVGRRRFKFGQAELEGGRTLHL